MTKMQTAAEAARGNLAKAEDYLQMMADALKDAQCRARIARNLRDEARDAWNRADRIEATNAVRQQDPQ